MTDILECRKWQFFDKCKNGLPYKQIEKNKNQKNQEKMLIIAKRLNIIGRTYGVFGKK